MPAFAPVERVLSWVLCAPFAVSDGGLIEVYVGWVSVRRPPVVVVGVKLLLDTLELRLYPFRHSWTVWELSQQVEELPRSAQ